jgi:N-hydroxyarylamine O-acetyltransferase
VLLDAYFTRLGLSRPRFPTREALDALVHAHARAIPFENLDVLLGKRISLEPEALERKLVHEGRGGYCFEQNALLLQVLEGLGFHVRPLSARVRIGRPRDDTPPRTHLFVRVELDGQSLLVDVGVGGLSLTSSLLLEADREQPTPHETRRLVQEGGRWFHQAKLGEEWQDVCEFTLEEMPPIDREVANWFTSTHPQSHFKSRLVVSRALPDGGRMNVLNRELTMRRRDGTADRRMIESPQELLAVLAEKFALRFEPGTRFECSALDWP